jgi:hypothetical protein
MLSAHPISRYLTDVPNNRYTIHYILQVREIIGARYTVRYVE